MNDLPHWTELTDERKSAIFTEINKQTGLPPQAVEKDWWVVQTLRLVFQMECAGHLVFKGGTSLSKAWGLIERFSEDIDLALDRAYLGFEKNLTISQIKKLRKASFRYISETFFPALRTGFSEAGLNVEIQLAEVTDTDRDPLIIEIYYPSALATSEYLLPRVLIEIGARSLLEPNSPRTFSSLVGEHFADFDFADLPLTIATVNPEKTFLEKIFLLHEEFQKQADRIRVERLSRHLYDVERLMDTGFAKTALQDQNLYDDIVAHRKLFTPIRGVDYSLHRPEHLNFIPPDSVKAKWEKDYQLMRENMIYGESPTFETLMRRIKQLNQQINES